MAKKQQQFMLKMMWRKGKTMPLLVGVHICSTSLSVTMAVCQCNSQSSNSSLRHTPKGCEFIQKGHLFNYVHRTQILNGNCESQKGLNRCSSYAMKI